MNTTALPQLQTCATCRHALTHAKCRISGCSIAGGVNYRAWEPGDAEEDMHEAQLDGIHPVHVDGEADIFATDSIESALWTLKYVARQCGYTVARGAAPEQNRIFIDTREGRHIAQYENVPQGRLVYVWRILNDNSRRLIWTRFPKQHPGE